MTLARRVAPLIALVVFATAGTWWIATSGLTEHFWDYYFFPDGEPWWKGAVWGNVIAIWPSFPVLAAAGVAGYILHQRAIAPLHEQARIHERQLTALAEQHTALADQHGESHRDHMKILGTLLDAMDPDTDGPIQQVLDRLDIQTPGGISDLAKKIDGIAPKARSRKPTEGGST